MCVCSATLLHACLAIPLGAAPGWNRTEMYAWISATSCINRYCRLLLHNILVKVYGWKRFLGGRFCVCACMPVWPFQTTQETYVTWSLQPCETLEHMMVSRWNNHALSSVDTPPTVCGVSTPPGKSWTYFCKISWPGKSWKMGSWKFKSTVLESLGICWNTNAVMQTRMQRYSRPHTSSFCDLFLHW